MNKFEMKAIELHYEGASYREISQAIGGRLTEKVLKNYFSIGGRLYLPYLEYEGRQNKERQQGISSRMRAKLSYLDKVMDSLLQGALKRKDYKLAFEIVKEQMDRAGFVVDRKIKVETDQREVAGFETYEQYADACRRLGIDPETGLSSRLSSAGNAQGEEKKTLRA